MHRRFIKQLFDKHNLSDSLSYSINDDGILIIIARYQHQIIEIDISLINALEVDYNTISLITRYGKYSFIKKKQLITKEKKIEKILKKIFGG